MRPRGRTTPTPFSTASPPRDFLEHRFGGHSGRRCDLSCGEYAVEVKFLGQAAQCVGAAVAEAQPGPGNEIAHRARHDGFARFGDLRDARRDMHGNAADVVGLQLDLAGVHAAAQYKVVVRASRLADSPWIALRRAPRWAGTE
jgi:hypothetical protein